MQNLLKRVTGVSTLPVGFSWDRICMLEVFFWVSFLFKVPLSLLHSQCPCLTWPDTHRDNAFVHTDMSGGGAQTLLQSIAPFQAAE